MRMNFPATLLLVYLVALPAFAQHYADFDACGYDTAPAGTNGLRVYFDASVQTGCAGTLASPGYYAWATAQSVDAYLVLTHPTAAEFSSWQCDFEITGHGHVQDTEFFGLSAVSNGSGATYVVDFTLPLALGATHVPLARFGLLLAQTDPQFGQTYGLVEFHLRPATGQGEIAPGYVAGGAFVPCTSFTSVYNGWDVPCMLLNDNHGVVDVRETSWGAVKTLFR